MALVCEGAPPQPVPEVVERLGQEGRSEEVGDAGQGGEEAAHLRGVGVGAGLRSEGHAKKVSTGERMLMCGALA